MVVQIFAEQLKRIRSLMEQKSLPAILVNHAPNIFYLSGFSGSSGWLLLTEKRACLFTDFRYLEQAAQEAPLFELIKLTAPQGPSFFEEIGKFLKGEKLPAIAVEEAHLSWKDYDRLKEAVDGLALLPCGEMIEELRTIKDEEEIARIAFAARIADNALRETLPLIKAGMSELELAAELEYRMRRSGAAGAAFSTIVASGPRSAMPHGLATDRRIGEGEFIIIDFGAVWQRYCSDMTRTFILGEALPEQERIYALVCAARELALGAIRTGERAAHIDGEVRRFFAEEGIAHAFGHGLGHGVGIEVHERPALSPRSKDILQERMIFSVEPGLYLEGWGGVRVEDLVVLRPQGPQLITGSGWQLGINI